jgi:chaperonin GroES
MSELKIKPLGIRVLVEQIAAETKTASGLIIPDSAKEKPLQAKVVAIGNDVDQIKIGETVVYGKFIGTELNFEGKDYLILEQSEILAVI